ncbi:MAG: ribonuclease P protein component [Bacteroidota bacterium]
MSRISYRFPKSSRLYLRKEISDLFNQGQLMRVMPFLAYVKRLPFDGSLVRLVISVPKRRLKMASDRNRVKRLVRESYRLNLPHFLSKLNPAETIHLAVVFQGNKVPDFKTVSAKIILTLQRLTGNHEENIDRHNDSSNPVLP